MIYFVIDFTQFLGGLTCECVLFDSLNRLTDLYGYLLFIIQHDFDLKNIEAIPPIVYNDGYLHKKVRGKTSSLVALYHYMCLYTRNSWEMEAIFNTVLFQETEQWNLIVWAILATSRLLDTLKRNFRCMLWKFFQVYLSHSM